jgi:hypothetical protein
MAGESIIRKALKARVEQYGGEVRAVSWLGRRHAPDVLVILPGKWHAFVECKAPGKKVTQGQHREHQYMRSAGILVDVIATQADIDAFLPPL